MTRPRLQNEYPDRLLELLAGDLDTWRRVSRAFLDDVRKESLVWRTLSAGDRQLYVAELGRWEPPGAGAARGEE